MKKDLSVTQFTRSIPITDSAELAKRLRDYSELKRRRRRVGRIAFHCVLLLAVVIFYLFIHFFL